MFFVYWRKKAKCVGRVKWFVFPAPLTPGNTHSGVDTWPLFVCVMLGDEVENAFQGVRS